MTGDGSTQEVVINYSNPFFRQIGDTSPSNRDLSVPVFSANYGYLNRTAQTGFFEDWNRETDTVEAE